MLTLLKQARNALALLNPEEVRSRAGRPVTIGLVASSEPAYEQLEDFLGGGGSREFLFRAGTEGAPGRVDLVICEAGFDAPPGAYALDPAAAGGTLAEIARHRDELALGLARHYPAFRRAVVDRAIQAVARENALFAVATALPDVVPNLIELPWALGEWASDTAFLTTNQLRMAFYIAAAYASFSSENQYTLRRNFTYTLLAGLEYSYDDAWALSTGYRWFNAGHFKGPRYQRVASGSAVDVGCNAWNMRFRANEWFIEFKIFI